MLLRRMRINRADCFPNIFPIFFFQFCGAGSYLTLPSYQIKSAEPFFSDINQVLLSRGVLFTLQTLKVLVQENLLLKSPRCNIYECCNIFKIEQIILTTFHAKMHLTTAICIHKQFNKCT